MQVLANPDRKGGGGLTTPEKPSMAKEARPVRACGALFSALVLAVSVSLVALSAGYASSDDKKTDDKRSDDKNAEAKIAQLKAELAKAKKELEAIKKKNKELEDQVVALVVAAENAKKEEVKAKNAAKLALAIADDNAKKLSGPNEPKRRDEDADKPQPKMPANFRCEVTKIAGDLVMLDAGIDSGLGVGTVLDVYRLEKSGGRYLGTVKVTSASNLFPKQAIVSFTPAGNVPLDKLKPEDLPRKGDEVRSPEALVPEKK
jgi:hypothetical protein